MAEELKTYYDFADNNYDFLMAAYKNGLVGNAMGAMAQETCEKYLKHLIDEYVRLPLLVAPFIKILEQQNFKKGVYLRN